jgi:hypothetical protein
MPGQRPGNKGGIGLGMPIPSARKRELTSLRRATAYSQKSTSNHHHEQIKKFLILIKDYPENKSKGVRQKVGNVGQKPRNDYLNHRKYAIYFIKNNGLKNFLKPRNQNFP